MTSCPSKTGTKPATYTKGTPPSQGDDLSIRGYFAAIRAGEGCLRRLIDVAKWSGSMEAYPRGSATFGGALNMRVPEKNNQEQQKPEAAFSTTGFWTPLDFIGQHNGNK